MSKQEEIRKSYKQLEFDNLNVLTETFESYTDFQATVKKKLRDSFLDGYLVIYYLLNEDAPILDETVIDEAVDYSITGESVNNYLKKGFDEAVDGNFEAIKRTIATETHRLFVQGQLLGCKKAETELNKTIYKRWDATLDEKTRDTHFRLHGTTIAYDDYFETVNGVALAPGQFGIAEEDCNCRCILEILAYG